MPLVLSQNDTTESGHVYADVLGITYEYPKRYRRHIQSGELFVYYRGRRTLVGPLQQQAYLGAGVIGEITEVGELLHCRIDDYRAFPKALPFKKAGNYYEVAAANYGSRAGLYFRNGARVIDDETFRRIVADGFAGADHSSDAEVVSAGYASAETARLVDEVAMKLAIAEAARRWPEATVTRMPHNNPGFDIKVQRSDGLEHYVEVKGTQRDRPIFFISEGELLYSERHSEHYRLWVFSNISLTACTGDLTENLGKVGPPAISLRPKQWVGTCLVESSSACGPGSSEHTPNAPADSNS